MVIMKKLTAAQLRRIIKEEVEAMMPAGGKDPQRFLHGFESGHPMDDEGYMIKSRMADVKEMAETICGLLDEGDQLPAWVQDLVASAHTDLEHVKDYLVGDEKLRSYDKEAPPVGMPVETRRRRGRTLKEGHARITEEEMAAWKSGDWGFVAENDGGGPRRRSMDVIPADPDKLRDYILRNYEGHCQDLGCDDVSDPEFKEYVSDQLAGKVDRAVLKTALAML
jgi:hypothetical protein